MQDKIQLGNAVLKGVSRSFYLSIRLLPRLMREPVSIAYLLARASDTLADTPGVPNALKLQCLDHFLRALKDEKQRESLHTLLMSKFIPYQEDERECLLLRDLHKVFAWYDTVREWAWNDIAEVLDPIVAGQKWDVQYFGIEGHKQVKDVEMLDTYCYQVAGCVGEFWSMVGKNAYKRFSKLSDEELQAKGSHYGKGLQLINILRDLPEDLENGRCYLPKVNPKKKEMLVKATEKYRKQARKYLENGLEYASSLRQKRSKIATVLPALIGLKTLDLMEDASWEDWQQGLKVSRKVVRKCLWQAIWWR